MGYFFEICRSGLLALLASTLVVAQVNTMTIDAGGHTFKVDWYDDGRFHPVTLKWTTDDVFSRFRFDTDGAVKFIRSGAERYRVVYDDDSGSLEEVRRVDLESRMLLDESREGVEFENRRLYSCSDCEETWDSLCDAGVASVCALEGSNVFGTLGASAVDIVCNVFGEACEGVVASAACDGQCESEGGSSSSSSCGPLNLCLNGGSCSASGDGYVCDCPLGYGGTSCETDTFVDFVSAQLTVLADEVLVDLGAFTDYTDTDGQWETVKSNGDTIDMTVWTSGMVAGMFWYMYELTGDTTWETKAEFFCQGLEGVELLDDNDLGFQVLNSFGQGYRLTASDATKESYKARVLAGADSLYDFRWDANIPAFWSWANPTSRPEWERAVNVDMIMNMEIMLWASVNGGDPTYADAVVGHADATWLDIVRDDNSTFHVADFDPATGDLVDQGTYQGYNDASTWTRGQAWAIYGYVMVYRYLQEPRFLSRAQGLLKYFQDSLPEDLVPPSDFDAPVDATLNGKDSSASAIVTSALLELYVETGDVTYLTTAETYLSVLLAPDYYLPDATDGYQSILRRSMSKWSEPEVGSVTGDYFLIEAMVRYRNLSR